MKILGNIIYWVIGLMFAYITYHIVENIEGGKFIVSYLGGAVSLMLLQLIKIRLDR